MKLFKIIFSSIFVLLLSTFFFVFTYLNPNSTKVSDINLGSGTTYGLSKLTEYSNKISFLPTKAIEAGKFYKDNINNLDEIYFSPDSIDSYKRIEKSKNNNIIIDLKNGMFFANIKDITFNYSISNEAFKIVPKSSGRFLIDTRDMTNIKIFSLDSILQVDLLNPLTASKSTEIILYPHMNFAFNSGRNAIVKNADLLRLESIFEISYIKMTFLSGDINEFINSIYKTTDDKAKGFLDNVQRTIYLSQDYLKFTTVDNFIIKNNYVIPGIEYISKYFILLLNDSKKSAYYKNDILTNLNIIAKSTQEREINSSISSIKEDLTYLKDLNDNSYESVYSLVSYYYENLLKTNDIELVNNTFALGTLLIDLNGFNSNSRTKKSSFLINKLYSIIDSSNSDNVDLQGNLLKYLESFFLENGIKVDQKTNSISIKDSKKLLSDLDSLSFFIKNVLIFNTNFSYKDSMNNTLSLLKTYFYINNSLSLISESKYESLIIEYSTILDNTLVQIRNSFFEKDLDKNNLLIVNKNNILTRNDVKNIDNVVNLFFDFQNKNASHLSSKNIIYTKFYASNKVKYDEYHLALDNYNEYIISYNKTKSDLFTTKTIAENSQNNVSLNQDNLNNFLSYFYGLDLSNSNIKIINDEYYEIKNIFINGINFSFDLYPKYGNRIQNIYKNGQPLNLSYELDSIKYDLKDMYDAAEGKEKDKYDFKRFFVNTFFEQVVESNNSSTQFVYETSDSQEEDRSISLFKRDKLVGQSGEFTLVKSILPIKYEDISVTLKDNNYDINIKNSEFLIDNSSNIEDKILGKFSSKYVFTNTDHYFKNIRILLYVGENLDKGTPVFGGNEAVIEDQIDVRDFTSKFREIVNYFYDSRGVYSGIKSELGVDNIAINYNNGTISYEFNYNGKNIKIDLKGSYINSIVVSGNNILNNKNINYTEVTKYLKLIK